jgi:two-component system chemotaxis response regulator CheY
MKVLVADDETTSRLLARRAVERLSHECEVAADGVIAWEMLQATEYDVLITDWMMPGLDGPELCRRVRASQQDGYTYILMTTSLSGASDVIAGMEAGADDYLVKPVDPFALQTRLIAAQRVTELHHELSYAKTALTTLARTDPLTQLSNRLRLHEDLVAVQERARRSHRPFTVALCDLDGFKAYNDTYGHLEGDEALRRVGMTIARHIRTGDGAYRYGGEEFLILLPDDTPERALVGMERLRAAIEGLAIPHAGRRPPGIVTLSIGIAGWHPEVDETPAQVLEAADVALYTAKQHGRNRVVAPGVDARLSAAREQPS